MCRILLQTTHTCHHTTAKLVHCTQPACPNTSTLTSLQLTAPTPCGACVEEELPASSIRAAAARCRYHPSTSTVSSSSMTRDRRKGAAIFFEREWSTAQIAIGTVVVLVGVEAALYRVWDAQQQQQPLGVSGGGASYPAIALLLLLLLFLGTMAVVVMRAPPGGRRGVFRNDESLRRARTQRRFSLSPPLTPESPPFLNAPPPTPTSPFESASASALALDTRRGIVLASCVSSAGVLAILAGFFAPWEKTEISAVWKLVGGVAVLVLGMMVVSGVIWMCKWTREGLELGYGRGSGERDGGRLSDIESEDEVKESPYPREE